MRSVDVSIVTRNIKEMCIQANHFLSEDMDIAMKNAVETEKAPLGKQILTQLQENLKIAGEDPNLSGYWYGGRVHRSWSGGTL